jgi:hypothetical protein
MNRRLSIATIAVLFSLFLNSVFAFGSTSKTQTIPTSSAPFFISLWSVDKETYERKKFICNATLIDTYFAVTSASCLKKTGWPITGSYGVGDRSERGFTFPVYTWTWTEEFDKDPSFHDLALIYAPWGISPWDDNLKSAGSTPTISYPSTGNYTLTTWLKSGTKNLLSSTTVKIVGAIPSKDSSLPKDNIFFAGVKPKGSKTYSDACSNAPGSPLTQETSTGRKVIGISVAPIGKCDAKLPTRYVLLSKFANFIDGQKISLVQSFLDERRGESIKPILQSVRAGISKQYLDSTVDGEGRRSSIWTSYDPQAGWADVWSLGFYVWKNGRYQATLTFRNSLDGCMLAKQGSILLQVSKNSKQSIDYSAKVTDAKNCWVNGQIYTYPEIKSSKSGQSVDCSIVVQPTGDKFSTDPTEKIKNLSLLMDQGCLGLTEKIWIRFSVRVTDGVEDIDLEPFNDGWYGPFQSSIF